MSRRYFVWIVLVLVGLFSLCSSGVMADGSPEVRVVKVQGVINPVMSGYVQRSIQVAEKENIQTIVLEIDTPGGLSTSMEEMTQAIVNSKVPVVCYVSPQGGRAASAGVFIVMASHLAAMAPNTNIGAAHPVSATGEQMDETMTAKATNDAVARMRSLAESHGRNAEWAEKAVRESVSITETEAKAQGVVEYIANDVPSLLAQIDGQRVILINGEVTLRTAGATIDQVDMNFIEDFLLAISDPNIAYILMILGINGLLFELMSPGAVFPGVIGAISLLLSFFALGALPVNYAGIGLILLAFILFVADVKMPTHGVLTVGGIASMVLGSLILINSDAPYFAVSWSVIAGVVIATAGFFILAITAVVRAHRKPAVTGTEGILGAIGLAKTEVAPRGVVLLQGENWDAVTDGEDIAKGDRVVVTAMEGLHLIVRPHLDELLSGDESGKKERRRWGLLRD